MVDKGAAEVAAGQEPSTPAKLTSPAAVSGQASGSAAAGEKPGVKQQPATIVPKQEPTSAAVVPKPTPAAVVPKPVTPAGVPKPAVPKGRKRPGGEPSGPVDAKKLKAEGIKRALGIKHRYLQAVTVQTQICSQIKTDPSYSWADTEKQHARLQRVQDTLAARVNNFAFAKFFLVNEMGTTRQRYGDETDVLLQRFAGDLEEAVRAMESEHGRLNRMHIASLNQGDDGD